MKPERSIVRGYTTFCDDIRQEVNGKLILIGVYGADMLVPGFPAVLPRLCILTFFRHYPDEPHDTLKVKVFGPGAGEPVLTELDVDLAAAVSAIGKPVDSLRADFPEETDPFFQMRLNIEVVPLLLQEPGYIRVRAFQKDTGFKLGSLEVKKAVG